MNNWDPVITGYESANTMMALIVFGRSLSEAGSLINNNRTLKSDKYLRVPFSVDQVNNHRSAMQVRARLHKAPTTAVIDKGATAASLSEALPNAVVNMKSTNSLVIETSVPKHHSQKL